MNDPIMLLLLLGIGGVSFWAWNDPTITAKYIFNAYVIDNRKQYWRFVTHAFLHADYMHLFFNLIAFHSFGQTLLYVFKDEYYGFGAVMGSLYFLGLFFLGVIVSSIPSYFKHKSNPGYNSLGASGGVSAVLFAYMLLFPAGDVQLFFAIPVPIWVFGPLYLYYSHWAGRNRNDNIGHDAHFWGSIFGLAYVALTYPYTLDLFKEGLRQMGVL